jgi:hypothetical protein
LGAEHGAWKSKAVVVYGVEGAFLLLVAGPES